MTKVSTTTDENATEGRPTSSTIDQVRSKLPTTNSISKILKSFFQSRFEALELGTTTNDTTKPILGKVKLKTLARSNCHYVR